MPIFEDFEAHAAAEGVQALRGLAHATRTIEDPGQVYEVMGSLTQMVAALEQSLRQLADFHDGPARRRVRVDGDPRAGRAAAYQVSWELRRAAEILRYASGALDRAHEIEGSVYYAPPDVEALAEPRRKARRGLGMSL